jgi:CRISPR/Cas system-associated endonuclease Cas1
MAATENVRQLPQFHNSSAQLLVPRHGVVTLFGYGIQVRVDRGHLLLECGIGADRRYARLPRVRHGLKRLVCISEDGFTTLSALKWLADVGVSFSMLNRTGKVLFVTGPTAPSDARLRRAQALALSNGVGVEICRKLIDAKLEGQERLVRERLHDSVAAQEIAVLRDRLKTADTADAIRWLEAHAAVMYFGALRNVPVLWPKMDLARIPEHWRTVGSRQSPLSGGPRLAVTPVHAILNYCFALLESESRLALAALGLDVGLGLGLHTDTPNRDSLALDVLEPVRPDVEKWLLAWITREPLRRADFFESANGNCRLMSHLCVKLSETAPTWGKLVAPWAEYVASTLWASASGSRGGRTPSTPLTQQHRREAKGQLAPPNVFAPRPQRVCRGCGAVLSSKQLNHCALCGVSVSRGNMIEIARRGRAAFANSKKSRARLSASQKRQNAARRGWLQSSLPAWLTQSSYREMILPRLAGITIPTLARTMKVTEPYAAEVRKGRHVPHPMHWQALAELVGVSANA